MESHCHGATLNYIFGWRISWEFDSGEEIPKGIETVLGPLFFFLRFPFLALGERAIMEPPDEVNEGLESYFGFVALNRVALDYLRQFAKALAWRLDFFFFFFPPFYFPLLLLFADL